MTQDIHIRKEGTCGRITLNRPEALNALTYDMCLAIDAALQAWEDDRDVALVLIDATGDRAFCAGGDIAEMYATGTRGDYSYGRKFWADEYAMNARLFRFPKPVVSFLQGFTMGGGVGVGCHASHRIVGDSSKIAMPEVSIGLVPDVGGSLLLARAPGRLGEYLGLTAARMGPGDAILAEFADYYVPEANWDALKADLIETGDVACVDAAAGPAPEAKLGLAMDQINATFDGEDLRSIANALEQLDGEWAEKTSGKISRNSPLSMACAVELIHRVRARDDIGFALQMEYRATARSMEHGDFIEGIRAAIIDRDGAPKWKHDGPDAVPATDVSAMLRPLGPDELKL